MTKVWDVHRPRNLELGPVSRERRPAPGGTGSSRATTDGVAWLVLDKQGASANTLSEEVLAELNDVLEEIERDLPKGLVHPLRQAQRLHRRRRHRRVPRHDRCGR